MGLKLLAEIGLDGAGFERGLHRAGEKVSEFSADTIKNAAIAAFGIYGVEEAIAKTVETATELVNESKRLDVTVEQLQLLRQAAKDGGTEMGTLASAFERLDVARAKALSGDKSAIAAFAKLGINQSALQTQTAATLFTGQLSTTVKNGNVESLAEPLKEILGKGFGELLPVLKTDFDELGDSLHKVGGVMDAETAVKLKSMGDQFDLISLILASSLGPALVQFTDWLVDLFVNSKLVESVDFLAKRTANLAKLPDFTTKDGRVLSAEARNEAADDFRTHLLQAITDKTTWEQFKEKYKYALTEGVFSDFKGNSFPEFRKYLSDLSTPVIDATQDAATGSSATMEKLRASVEEYRKKLAATIDALEHPKPPNGGGDDPNNKTPKAQHLAAIGTDALVRVGNFLGSNGNTISRVDQQKISLLKTIAKHTEKLGVGTGAGSTYSFLGVPLI